MGSLDNSKTVGKFTKMLSLHLPRSANICTFLWHFKETLEIALVLGWNKMFPIYSHY